MAVNFWHVLDDGKDSSELLGTLVDTFGSKPQLHRGAELRPWWRFRPAARLALAGQGPPPSGAHVITLPRLHEASMRKIDANDTSFWKAIQRLARARRRSACSNASA